MNLSEFLLLEASFVRQTSRDGFGTALSLTEL